MNDIIPVGSSDNRPLPLIVAEKWNFRLDYVFEEGNYWFAGSGFDKRFKILE